MSQTVEITPGGLAVRRWDGDLREDIVTPCREGEALYLLRCPCVVAPHTTLRDLFRAVAAHDMLVAFLAMYSWCGDIEEFHKQAELPRPEDDDSRITHLEVYWHATVHTYNGERSFDMAAGFHGTGPADEDLRQMGLEVTLYSVSYSPMNEIAHLPLRLNEEFRVRDHGGPKAKGLMFTARRSFTLLDVLDAIYDDISFMGGPEDNVNFLREMGEQVGELRARFAAGEQIGLPLEDLLSSEESDPC